MPAIGEFIERFATILEATPGGVLKVQRMLRDARLISTGARGVNAPQLDQLDAARMLIAFAVTDRPSLAVPAVIEFGRLKASMRTDFDENLDPVHRVFHEEMDGADTVEDGIIGLFAAYERLSPEDRAERGLSSRIKCDTSEMSVTLEWPGGVAVFSNDGSWRETLAEVKDNGVPTQIDERLAAALRAAEAASKYSELNGARRVRVTRTISGEVFAKIAEMFLKESGDA